MCWKRYHIIFSTISLKFKSVQKEVIHSFKNHTLVTWPATNSLILRKWCGFEKLNYYYYFGGARNKGFATLRNVSKLTFFDKIGHAKSVGFRFYSAIWRSESRISSRYLEITSTSLIYSLTFSRKKTLLIWLSRGLNLLICVTRRIRD